MKTEQTEQLIERIFRMNKVMHTHMKELIGSSHGEFKMLGVICGEMEQLKSSGSEVPGITVSKLSKCLMHSKPATSKMLNNLEDKGYIERITTKEDRRAVYVVPTKEGAILMEDAKNRMSEYTNRVLEKLGEEDTNTLLAILDHIYTVVSENGDYLVQGLKKEESAN